jgi:hypothetical protein
MWMIYVESKNTYSFPFHRSVLVVFSGYQKFENIIDNDEKGTVINIPTKIDFWN